MPFDKLKDVPLLSGIYIVQQKKLHDSGYRMMYVIGHTDWDYEKKDYDYYLLGSCSDVVDFGNYFSKAYTEDLHIDINRNGLIHIWSNKSKFKCSHCLSSCIFEVV